MKPLKLIPILSVLALTILTAAYAEDATSEIYDACNGKKERIRLSDALTGEEKDPIREGIEGSLLPPEIFRNGTIVGKGRTPEQKELGDYLKARSYYVAGLSHLAYDQLVAYIGRPIDAATPIVGRMAAVECVSRLVQEFPSLGFDAKTTEQMVALLKRPGINERYRDVLSHALLMRTKELVNNWNPTEAEVIVQALSGMGGYGVYAQALLLQRHGQYAKAIPLWERLIEKGELPPSMNDNRETIIMLYARNLFEAQNFEKSAEILRQIPRDSNYLAQALSDLSWALLQSGKKPEAIGAAFNIQKSLLTRVYAPEAPLVASIALHEMCQYARALKNAVFFKKKYLPVLLWYRKLPADQQSHPYQLLVNALRKKSGVPNVVLLEWLRSPEYRALQLESNLYYDEKKVAFAAHSQRIVAPKGATWPREYKQPIPKFYNEIEKRQRKLGKRMNETLDYLTKRITKQIARMYDNVQLLEIEIYDNAGEDMVWRNANADYPKWVSEQPEESRAKDLYWEWGSTPVDPKSRDEVWEDELGWTLGNVSDECTQKKKYREAKYGAAKATTSIDAGTPTMTTSPATKSN